MVKIFQKKNNNYIIKHNKKEYKIIPMTFEEAIKFFFILIPYIRAIKQTKRELDPLLFLEVARNYIEQFNPRDLANAVAILLHTTADDAKDIPLDLIINNLPRIILVNNLYNLYGLLRSMGAFE